MRAAAELLRVSLRVSPHNAGLAGEPLRLACLTIVSPTLTGVQRQRWLVVSLLIHTTKGTKAHEEAANAAFVFLRGLGGESFYAATRQF